MSSVEDRDLGFGAILAELRKLGEMEVRTGIQGADDSAMVTIATINEFGSRAWKPSWKQAYYLALLIVLQRRPEQGQSLSAEQKAQAFAIARKLRGRLLRIPERSFLRATFDAQRGKLEAAAERVVGKVLDGKMTADEAAQTFAQFAETLFRRGLLAVKRPPNAPLTIALKKSSQPLVDSGRLRASIRSIVAPRRREPSEDRPV